MKILHIVNSLKCGGLEKLVVDLADSVQRNGMESSICCLQGSGELLALARQKGIKVFSLIKNPGLDFKLIWDLRASLKREDIDIVHTHNMAPLIYGTLAAKFLGKRLALIHTRHGREPESTFPFIWNWNHAIIPVSLDAQECLMQSNKVKKDKIRVIYNAVSTQDFRILPAQEINEIKTEFAMGPYQKIIGIVARLSPEKDHKTLLAAFARVCQQNPNVVLLIVGDGKLEQSLKEVAKGLSILDRVKFLGFRQDVSRIVNIFDVFVLSSLTEGISLTLLEAMAAGKPIVATDVGGNPEVVVNNETGLLVPAKNAEEMAHAINRILCDPSLAKRMGEAGRKRVEEKFSLERMTREYLEVYQKVLKQ